MSKQFYFEQFKLALTTQFKCKKKKTTLNKLRFSFI